MTPTRETPAITPETRHLPQIHYGGRRFSDRDGHRARVSGIEPRDRPEDVSSTWPVVPPGGLHGAYPAREHPSVRRVQMDLAPTCRGGFRRRGGRGGRFTSIFRTRTTNGGCTPL